MDSLIEQFIEIANQNGISTQTLKEKEEELKSLGYNFEEYFKSGETSIVRALSANAKEANAILDVSDEEKLSYVIDAENLIIVIDKSKIFDSMHKAYKEAYASKSSNYMIFVSQESKTADIEKQLVSGVQGAKHVEFVIV
jgi:L-lactate dehydrogenase complex protein LldG